MSIPSLQQLAREAFEDYAKQGLYGKIDKPREYEAPNTLVIEEMKENEALSHRLNSLLDEPSKKKLRHLKLKNKNPFPKEWAAMIQLPSLETLVIGPITHYQFSNFCRFSQNLRVFQIGSFNGSSLDGVGELKNLEVLSIRNQYLLKTPESIMPIFKCTKLKVLDLSRDLDYSITEDCVVLENYLKCDKVLPELVHLDCKRLDLDGDKLIALLEGHPNLKQIVALNTDLDYIDIVHPGLQLLNRASDQSLIGCFQHYLAARNEDSIELLVTDLDNHVAVTFHLSEKAILVKFMRLVCQTLKEFGSSKRVVKLGVNALYIMMSLLRQFDVEQEDLLMVADQLISSGTQSLTDKSARDVLRTIWEILGKLKLRKVSSQMRRRFITFCLNYLKVANHPIARFMLKVLPEKLNPEDLLASLPRSDVFEPLAAWIDLKPLSRMEEVLELCSNPEILERLGAHSVYTRIVMFWNSSEELTNEQIKSMRDLMTREKENLDSKLLAQYMISKIPKLPKNFNSTTFFAMEFLTNVVISGNSTIERQPTIENYETVKEVDAALQNLCLEFRESGQTFPHFPGTQLLQDALHITRFDGPAEWALLMVRMMMWNLNRSTDSRKNWLGYAIACLENRSKMIMELRDEVLKNWKSV